MKNKLVIILLLFGVVLVNGCISPEDGKINPKDGKILFPERSIPEEPEKDMPQVKRCEDYSYQNCPDYCEAGSSCPICDDIGCHEKGYKDEWNLPEIDKNICNVDNNCVIKPTPYCCGENKGHIDRCFFINDEPEDISCENVMTCPGFLPIDHCECINNVCESIPKDDSIGA